MATPTNIGSAHYTDLLPIVPAPPSPWLVVVIALVAPRVVVGVWPPAEPASTRSLRHPSFLPRPTNVEFRVAQSRSLLCSPFVAYKLYAMEKKGRRKEKEKRIRCVIFIKDFISRDTDALMGGDKGRWRKSARCWTSG